MNKEMIFIDKCLNCGLPLRSCTFIRCPRCGAEIEKHKCAGSCHKCKGKGTHLP